ncbi:GIP [Symbiodinium natans]|uniref:GIP protein n=1 Tax=Symbiodinium natans TaxID=878477 RepID=A0A812L2F5_9DINO|nr:GIP [Symbiodinium natans]
MSERETEEVPSSTKRKAERLDSTGRPFVLTHRGGKKSKRQQELRQAVLEGAYQPQAEWSEQKRLEYAKLLSIQERRKELDRLEREAQEGFVAAGGGVVPGSGVRSEASGLRTGGLDRLAVSEGPPASLAGAEREGKGERERERSPKRAPARPIPSSSVSSDRPIPSRGLAPTQPKRTSIPKHVRIPSTPVPTSAPETPVLSEEASVEGSTPKASEVPAKKAPAHLKDTKGAGTKGKARAQDSPKTKAPQSEATKAPKAPPKSRPATFKVSAVTPPEPKGSKAKARPKEKSVPKPTVAASSRDPVTVEVDVELEEPEAPRAARPESSVAKASSTPVVLRPRAGSLADPSSTASRAPQSKGKRASETVEASQGTIRVILDYHGVLDCDVAQTTKRERLWFCNTGIPEATQDLLVEALDNTPGLEFLVLSYVGKSSYEKRQEVINRVRKFARYAEQRGHPGKVKISICDRREDKQDVAKHCRPVVAVDDNWWIVESYYEHVRRAYWFCPNFDEEEAPKGCHVVFSWSKVLDFVKGCVRTKTPTRWKDLSSAA